MCELTNLKQPQNTQVTIAQRKVFLLSNFFPSTLTNQHPPPLSTVKGSDIVILSELSLEKEEKMHDRFTTVLLNP